MVNKNLMRAAFIKKCPHAQQAIQKYFCCSNPALPPNTVVL
jgi:hypothetical protein